VKELSLGQFLDRLASSDPTPGGGTASAVAGALAAGLLAMVSRLSAGKGGDDAAFQRTLAAAEEQRRALLDLAAKDAEAFDAVMRAMRLPKGTAEEKQRRLAVIQDVLTQAANVPLEVASRAVSLLDLIVAHPQLIRRELHTVKACCKLNQRFVTPFAHYLYDGAYSLGEFIDLRLCTSQ